MIKKIRAEIEALEFLYSSLKAVIPQNIGILPSQWNEENRIIPPEFSSKPGRLSLDNSPFWREVVDCFSPQSPVREIAVMKPNQIGFTQIVIEGAMGFFIDCFPQPILYVSADKELAELNMSTRIDALVQTADLQHKIKASVQKKHKGKTGDTKSRKEFHGGFIAAFGAKNPDKLRQVGYPVALVDEIDTFESDLKNQGDTIDLVRRRTDAFSETRKIGWGSTPLLAGNSNIDALFKQGDQSYYNVPCPHCGTEQTLIFGDKEGPGLKYKTDDKNRLLHETVYYQCVNGCKIKEAYKYEMNIKGKWIPTSTPIIKGMRSFHINALYSNFFKWSSIIEVWISAINTKDPAKKKAKLKVFKNNILAETWEEVVKSIKYVEVMKNRRNYKPMTIPNELSKKDGNGKIIVVTGAVDVNGRLNESDGWLAFEVKGHCVNGQTYSIGKTEIRGNIDPGGNAWRALKEILEQKIISDCGMEYHIDITGVDVGFKPDSGYWFASVCERVVAVAGKSTIAKNDKVIMHTKVNKGVRWSIDTVYYKNMIADNIRQVWTGSRKNENDTTEQPYGFMNFPLEEHRGGFESAEFETKYGIILTGHGYNQDYFKCFGSEYPIIETIDDDDTGKVIAWRKQNSRSATHFWDVTVYNMAVRDIFLDIIGREVLKQAKTDPLGIIGYLSEYIESEGVQWG